MFGGQVAKKSRYMNKKPLETAINIFIVIAIIALFACFIVISSQFAVKHGIIKVESTDIQYADVFCIEVLKPRPVSTLVANR